jgi:hypothetical protein
MIEDSEDGSEDEDSDNETEDHGGEGSSSEAAMPSAPQDDPPSDDTKDEGEVAADETKSEAGTGDMRPRTGDIEVSLPIPSCSYTMLHLGKPGTSILWIIAETLQDIGN